MSTSTQLAAEKMVFRKTNAQSGRHISVTPANSTNRHLAYGRIILDRSTPAVSFADGDRETALIVLSGRATVVVGADTIVLEKFDSIYIPRDSSLNVVTD